MIQQLCSLVFTQRSWKHVSSRRLETSLEKVSSKVKLLYTDSFHWGDVGSLFLITFCEPYQFTSLTQICWVSFWFLMLKCEWDSPGSSVTWWKPATWLPVFFKPSKEVGVRVSHVDSDNLNQACFWFSVSEKLMFSLLTLGKKGSSGLSLVMKGA